MDEHVIDYWHAVAAVRQAALQAIYHRLLDTLAEEWVAPNPRASARCQMAQWGGGRLCEMILDVLTDG